MVKTLHKCFEDLTHRFEVVTLWNLRLETNFSSLQDIQKAARKRCKSHKIVLAVVGKKLDI